LLSAKVSAFDISPELVEIARRRAARMDQCEIDFRIMAAEKLDYPDEYFDMVVFVDILHHVDISATMREVQRVLKPSGVVIGDELYTHSALQRVRDSKLVAKGAYPLMRRWIYGTNTPYITEDEHKIDEREFQIVRDSLVDWDADYFGVFEGRLFPNHIAWAARIDRSIMRALRPIASVLGSRVVFRGKIRKTGSDCQ
jgi:SAM-dependent methyltransferase